MRGGDFGVKGVVGGLCGVGLALSACSVDDHDCRETRTCAEPVGYIDAGNFDDWWSAGAAGESAPASDPGRSGAAGAPGESDIASGQVGESAGIEGDASAGGVGASGAGGASSVVSAVPSEAPRVLRVDPLDGALGVGSDAAIVVTFSEPMDESSCDAAYESTDLPATSLVFDWNAEHSLLTLKPRSPLSYQAGTAQAAGDDPFPPKTYQYGFSDLARDHFGRALASSHFTFSTLRQVSAELAADGQRTGNWTDGEGEGIDNCLRNAAAPYAPSVCIGDDSNNIRYTGFVSFDLSGLPPGIAQFSSARLLANALLYGSPDALGASLLGQVAFGDLGEAALAAPPSANLGSFYSGTGLSTGTHFELAEDLTSAVAEDYARRSARSNLSQFRFSFAKISANNAWDDIELPTSGIRLSVTYLVP